MLRPLGQAWLGSKADDGRRCSLDRGKLLREQVQLVQLRVCRTGHGKRHRNLGSPPLRLGTWPRPPMGAARTWCQGMDHTHIRKTVDVDPAYNGPLGPMVSKEILEVLDELLLCMARSVVNTGHAHRRRAIGQLDDVVVLKAGSCAHTSVGAHEWSLHRNRTWLAGRRLAAYRAWLTAVRAASDPATTAALAADERHRSTAACLRGR